MDAAERGAHAGTAGGASEAAVNKMNNKNNKKRQAILARAARCRAPRPVLTRLLHEAGVDAAAVEACIAASGGTEADGGVNTVLEVEQAATAEAAVYLLPTVIVDGQVYHGNLGCRNPGMRSECGAIPRRCRCRLLQLRGPLRSPD